MNSEMASKLRLDIGQKKFKVSMGKYKIKSTSDYSLIDTDGNVFPGDYYSTVTLDVTVSSGNEQLEKKVEVLVPAKVKKPQNARNDYNLLKYGIFMHWIARNNSPEPLAETNSAIVNMTSLNKPLKMNEYVDLCNVPEICKEIHSLGFDFFALTDFHGAGITNHPCTALDFWRGNGIYSSKRDLVDELITEFEKYDIPVFLFTHPLDGHDFSKEQQELLGYNDPTDNYKRWNDFINDVYGDISARYGNRIAAMGFDSEFGQSSNMEWANKVDLARLRKTILTYAPNLILYSLSPANDLTDYSLKEAWRPSWLDPWMSRGNKSSDYEGEYDVEDWPCYYRPISPVITKHWTVITPPEEQKIYLTAEQMFRYAILQISSSIEGPGIMWGTSCKIDGGWEKGVKEALEKVNSYMAPIRESIKNAFPSTSYFLKEGTKLGELPHGICATRSRDNKFEYIHVLTPPSGNTLVLPLPEDGKKFLNAVCLNNNIYLQLTMKKDIKITIPDNMDWMVPCTTIKLTVDEKSIVNPSKAFHKFVETSSAVVSDNLTNCDYSRQRLTDGIKKRIIKKEDWSFDIAGWQSREADKNPWIIIDLNKTEEISKVILYSVDEGYEMAIDFSVYVSMNNRNYKKIKSVSDVEAPVKKVEVEFNKTKARYIKIQCERKRTTKFSLSEIEVF